MTETDTDDEHPLPGDRDYHLEQIEYHVAMARGEIDTTVTPYDYRFPTGEELKIMRNTCNLTATDVADALDFAETTVYNMEGGRTQPSLTSLKRLLALYKQEWPR